MLWLLITIITRFCCYQPISPSNQPHTKGDEEGEKPLFHVSFGNNTTKQQQNQAPEFLLTSSNRPDIWGDDGENLEKKVGFFLWDYAPPDTFFFFGC